MANHNKLLASIHRKVFLHRASGTGLDTMLDDMRTSNELEHAASLGEAEPLKRSPGYALMVVDPMPGTGFARMAKMQGAGNVI